MRYHVLNTFNEKDAKVITDGEIRKCDMQHLENAYPDTKIFTTFEGELEYVDALIGVMEYKGKYRAVYDYNLMLKELMETDTTECDNEEKYLNAVEHMEYNVLGAYFEGHPFVVIDQEEWEECHDDEEDLD